MGYLFLACPYRSHPAGIDDAWEASCLAALPFRRAKIAVYNPIGQNHPVAMQGGLDPHEDVWADLNEPFLLGADAVVVVRLPGWNRSQGIALERKLAEEHQIPVFEAAAGDVPLALVRWMERDNPPSIGSSLGIGDLREPLLPDDDSPISPSYYKGSGMSVTDFIESMGMDFCEGNIVKYVARYRGKNGKEDLQKARWYLNRLLDRE